MKSDHIIDEYRKGDADKRLSMFLHYGDHRSIFCSIERNHPMDLDAAQPASTPIQPDLFQRSLFKFRNRFSSLGCR